MTTLTWASALQKMSDESQIVKSQFNDFMSVHFEIKNGEESVRKHALLLTNFLQTTHNLAHVYGELSTEMNHAHSKKHENGNHTLPPADNFQRIKQILETQASVLKKAGNHIQEWAFDLKTTRESWRDCEALRQRFDHYLQKIQGLIKRQEMSKKDSMDGKIDERVGRNLKKFEDVRGNFAKKLEESTISMNRMLKNKQNLIDPVIANLKKLYNLLGETVVRFFGSTPQTPSIDDTIEETNKDSNCQLDKRQNSSKDNLEIKDASLQGKKDEEQKYQGTEGYKEVAKDQTKPEKAKPMGDMIDLLGDINLAQAAPEIVEKPPVSSLYPKFEEQKPKEPFSAFEGFGFGPQTPQATPALPEMMDVFPNPEPIQQSEEWSGWNIQPAAEITVTAKKSGGEQDFGFSPVIISVDPFNAVQDSFFNSFPVNPSISHQQPQNENPAPKHQTMNPLDLMSDFQNAPVISQSIPQTKVTEVDKLFSDFEDVQPGAFTLQQPHQPTISLQMKAPMPVSQQQIPIMPLQEQNIMFLNQQQSKEKPKTKKDLIFDCDLLSLISPMTDLFDGKGQKHTNPRQMQQLSLNHQNHQNQNFTYDAFPMINHPQENESNWANPMMHWDQPIAPSGMKDSKVNPIASNSTTNHNTSPPTVFNQGFQDWNDWGVGDSFIGFGANPFAD